MCTCHCHPIFSACIQTFVIENPQVEALGYVGIGFSPTGGMHGADIVLTWVDPDTGVAVLSVSHINDLHYILSPVFIS